MKYNLILCGLPGVGKTKAAALLAEKLKYRHIDTDECLEVEYAKHDGPLTCRQIYQKVGSSKFRQLEAEVLSSLLDCQKCIISIGGGTLTNFGNIALLKHIGKVCYLKQDREFTYQKLISYKGLPSYLDPINPRLSFDKLAEYREKIYESVADFKLDVSGLALNEVADDILKQICRFFTGTNVC